MAAMPAIPGSGAADLAGGLEILPIDLDDFGTVGGRTRTMPKILCCLCGIEIDANPAHMCVNCLRGQVDITEGIPKQVFMFQCRGCLRYLRPPWVACELESRELLAVCLKKITGLNKVKLIDAGFIWTEPHSKRLKVKLTIQKDVLNGVRLQQVFAVEFVLQNQQCDACAKSYTVHTWGAMVQVRQRVDHKKTFFLLEQLILKHNAHERCIGVTQLPNGVDFAFAERQHAMKFIDFLSSVVPVRYRKSSKLIGEDEQNGTSRYKFNFMVELVPLCKEDLVVLPSRTAAALGAINPLVLVQRVSSHVFVLDPRTLQMAEMSPERYWLDPHRPLMSAARLEEFTVLDVTPVTVTALTGAALRRKQGGRGSASAGGGTVVSASSYAGSTASGRKPRPAALAKLQELADLAKVQSQRELAAAARKGKKRPHGGDGGGDDSASTAGAESTIGGGSKASTARGGFTGAVSLAGGSITFNGLGGASSVASTVTGGHRGRMLLADAEVMKTRDMGHSDERFIVRTHLGNILRPGDSVLGYDVRHAVYNEEDAAAAATGGRSSTKGTAGRGGKVDLPDIVLVRKVYGRKAEAAAAEAELDAEAATARLAAADAAAAGADDGMTGSSSSSSSSGAAVTSEPARKQRLWKLKRLSDSVPTTYETERGASSSGSAGGNKRADRRKAAAGAGGDVSGDRDGADFESFLRDLESDPALRKTVNLYKDADAIARAGKSVNASSASSSSSAAAAGEGRRVKFARVGDEGVTAASSSSSSLSAAPSTNRSPTGGNGNSNSGAGDSDDDDEDREDEGEIGLEELLDDLTIGGNSSSSSSSAAAAAAAAEAAASSSAAADGEEEEEEDDGGEGGFSYGPRRQAAGEGKDAIPEAAAEEEEEEEEGADL